jgi:IclR family pca regulon transcriptional regulator
MPKLKRSKSERDEIRPGPEFIESLDRGLRVIEIFGSEPRPMTLSDVAKAAGLPRATARRILFTLEQRGFIRAGDKFFSLTPQVLRLASAFLSSSQLVSILQPAMDRLSSEAQEMSSMAVLDGDEVVFIARASPARVFSSGVDIGYRLPAFCTSVGRVLLGRLAQDELAAAIGAMKLTTLTTHTVVNKKVLLATISTDRAKGYSLVDREAEPGFRSLSVPVRRYDGTIVAAMNIGVHVDRIPTVEMISRFLPLLRNAAESVRPLVL